MQFIYLFNFYTEDLNYYFPFHLKSDTGITAAKPLAQ